MIDILFNGSTLHMRNEQISCLLKISQGHVLHDYFGPALPAEEPDSCPPSLKRSFTIEHPDLPGFWCDELPEVWAQAAQGTYRQEAFAFQMENGQSIFDFKFKALQIHERLLKPQDMPGLRDFGKTVEIILSEPGGLTVHLYYGWPENSAGMVRWNRLENHSGQPVHVRRMSSLFLPVDDPYDEILSLASGHLHEGRLIRQPFTEGIHSFSSRMGCSSGMHFPFLALCEKTADFSRGNVIAAQLLYSGNHETCCEKDPFLAVMQMGIHPWNFDWPVEPGSFFETPQALAAISTRGINGFAQTFHQMYLTGILPKQNPKILLNSWESLYYDTTALRVQALASQAAETGIERFVLDDGWFRESNSSSSPIGDWQTNMDKLPAGLGGMAETVQRLGMEFGLWIEPEAVSENSRLFQEHPDWILATPWTKPRLGRHEFLLDLSKEEVVRHILKTLDRILEPGNISYLKWDMNRPMTDLKSGNQIHGYILGLYRILRYLNTHYPDLTIEGCASGGQRLDGGMLCYVHQNWASDNTDSFDRIQIQSGLAFMFPPQVLCSHISAGQNHQTGRITSLNTRFQIARFFNPGYELDLSILSQVEREEIRKQIHQLKLERSWMKQAVFYQQPGCWVKVFPDGSQAEVLIFQEHFSSLQARTRWRIPGLLPEAIYHISALNLDISGARLLQQGISLPLVKEDFVVYPLTLVRIYDSSAQ